MIAKIKSVNHGKVFGKENWFTFYCENCNHQVWGDAKICDQCGASLQHKKDKNEI